MKDDYEAYQRVADCLLHSWSDLDWRMKYAYVTKSKKYLLHQSNPEYFMRKTLESDWDIFEYKEERGVVCNPKDFTRLKAIVKDLESIKKHKRHLYSKENKIIFFVIEAQSEYNIKEYNKSQMEFRYLDYFEMRYSLVSYILLSFDEYRRKHVLFYWQNFDEEVPASVVVQIRQIMNLFGIGNPPSSYYNIKEILLNEKPSMDGLFRIYCNINKTKRDLNFYQYLRERR